MANPSVLLMPGSVRRDAMHRRLAAAIEPLLAERGVDVELVDLGDHPMPIYDGDLEDEQGPPESAIVLAGRLRAADGLIVLTPEHNGGPSALLKNTIDWVTRVDRATVAHLLVALAATSPGRRGGAHGLGVVRSLFVHMSVPIADDDLSVPKSYEAFSLEHGGWTLARPEDRAAATEFVDRYVGRLGEHLGVLASADSAAGG